MRWRLVRLAGPLPGHSVGLQQVAEKDSVLLVAELVNRGAVGDIP
jgi:hypothetical protein